LGLPAWWLIWWLGLAGVVVDSVSQSRLGVCAADLGLGWWVCAADLGLELWVFFWVFFLFNSLVLELWNLTLFGC
jgi:hypothetical protein